MKKFPHNFCKRLVEILDENETLDKELTEQSATFLMLAYLVQDDPEAYRQCLIDAFTSISICKLLTKPFIEEIEKTNSVEIDWVYSLLMNNIRAIATLN